MTPEARRRRQAQGAASREQTSEQGPRTVTLIVLTLKYSAHSRTACTYSQNLAKGHGHEDGKARYTLRHVCRSTLLCWKFSVSSLATLKSCATGLQPSFEPQKSIFRSQ